MPILSISSLTYFVNLDLVLLAIVRSVLPILNRRTLKHISPLQLAEALLLKAVRWDDIKTRAQLTNIKDLVNEYGLGRHAWDVPFIHLSPFLKVAVRCTTIKLNTADNLTTSAGR